MVRSEIMTDSSMSSNFDPTSQNRNWRVDGSHPDSGSSRVSASGVGVSSGGVAAGAEASRQQNCNHLAAPASSEAPSVVNEEAEKEKLIDELGALLDEKGIVDKGSGVKATDLIKLEPESERLSIADDVISKVGQRKLERMIDDLNAGAITADTLPLIKKMALPIVVLLDQTQQDYPLAKLRNIQTLLAAALNAA